MGRYTARRPASLVVTLFLIVTLTFLLMHSMPGGPFTSNRALSTQVEEALRARYRLDEPLWKQFLIYIEGIVRLDLGPSIKYEGMSVDGLISEGFPFSTRLGAFALLLILVAGVPLGLPRRFHLEAHALEHARGP